LGLKARERVREAGAQCRWIIDQTSNHGRALRKAREGASKQVRNECHIAELYEPKRALAFVRSGACATVQNQNAWAGATPLRWIHVWFDEHAGKAASGGSELDLSFLHGAFLGKSADLIITNRPKIASPSLRREPCAVRREPCAVRRAP
jgi:hypothetical protein